MIIRIIAFVVLVIVITVIVRMLSKPLIKSKDACLKCGGLGYWEGVRNKEKCNDCNGTGKQLY